MIETKTFKTNLYTVDWKETTMVSESSASIQRSTTFVEVVNIDFGSQDEQNRIKVSVGAILRELGYKLTSNFKRDRFSYYEGKVAREGQATTFKCEVKLLRTPAGGTGVVRAFELIYDPNGKFAPSDSSDGNAVEEGGENDSEST